MIAVRRAAGPLAAGILALTVATACGVAGHGRVSSRGGQATALGAGLVTFANSDRFPAQAAFVTRPAYCVRFTAAIRTIVPRDQYLPTQSDYEDGPAYARTEENAGVPSALITAFRRVTNGVYSCEYGLDKEPVPLANVVLLVTQFRHVVADRLLARANPTLGKGTPIHGIGDWALEFGDKAIEAAAGNYAVEVVSWHSAPRASIRAAAARAVAALGR